MNAFLWTIAIIGLVEVGSTIAYWAVGRVPERTMAGSIINGIFWTGIAIWAISLIGG